MAFLSLNAVQDRVPNSKSQSRSPLLQMGPKRQTPSTKAQGKRAEQDPNPARQRQYSRTPSPADDEQSPRASKARWNSLPPSSLEPSPTRTPRNRKRKRPTLSLSPEIELPSPTPRNRTHGAQVPAGRSSSPDITRLTEAKIADNDCDRSGQHRRGESLTVVSADMDHPSRSQSCPRAKSKDRHTQRLASTFADQNTDDSGSTSLPFAVHQGRPAVPPIADVQNQFVLAQVMHNLNYLMAAIGYPSPIPPPHVQDANGHSSARFPSYPQPPWPPYTPTHSRHYNAHPAGDAISASSSTSAFATPTHLHPRSRSHTVDPSYSSGTLPPSSPEPSSPILVSASRSRSRGRSKSRGRRVSFKLDDDHLDRHSDEEAALDRPAHDRDEPRFATDLGARPGRTDRQPYIELPLRKGPQSGSRSRQPPSNPTGDSCAPHGSRRRVPSPVEVVSDSEPESAGLSDNESPSRGRRLVRGQTPGPSSPIEDSRGRSRPIKSVDWTRRP
jgi:hypothetical protein